MIADSEIAISATKDMAGTGVASFLSYLGKLVSLNALILSGPANFRVVGYSEAMMQIGSAGITSGLPVIRPERHGDAPYG